LTRFGSDSAFMILMNDFIIHLLNSYMQIYKN
jgi:hypothetical protein